MDDWKKINETSLPKKDKFYSNLNIREVAVKYYEHAKRVWKELEIKNLGEYHDLYVQIDTSFLDYVFETFRSRCIVIYRPDSTFFSAPGLA